MTHILRTRTFRRTLIAVACSLAVQAAQAQVFAPWASSDMSAAAGALAGQAAAPRDHTMTSGFAPWAAHTQVREAGAAAASMGGASGSVFRPWG